ncbi:hypothetical protein H5T87_05645 [bacterium]|nr:hypothetical protein [bacterium]
MDRDGLERIFARWGLLSFEKEEIMDVLSPDCQEGQVEKRIIEYFLDKGDYGWERIERRCLPVVEGMIRAKVPKGDWDMVREDIRSRIWEKIGSYKGEGKLDHWLRKLAKSAINEIGKTIKEIAEEEGKSIGTICAQCKKNKEFFREKLENFLLE